MKNIEARIADLEAKVGAVVNFPKFLVTWVFGDGEEDLHHGYTDFGGERKEIHRKKGESLDAFKARAKKFDGIVWMTS